MKKYLFTFLILIGLFFAHTTLASTFYMDPVNGNDATTATPYGWWSVTVTYVSGANPGAGSTMTGGISGATAITTIAPASWAAGTRTVYFYGKSGTFVSETVTFTNGATGTITADLTYCAWQTITSGATSARLTAGDTIRIARSPAPVSIGNGTWTSTTATNGGFPAAATVSGAVSAGGLIKLTVNQNIATGTVVQVLAVTGTVEANGVWIATNVDSTHITLNNSAFVNAYVSGGTCQNITSKAVVLATPQTQLIDDASPHSGAWTADNASTITSTQYSTDGKSGNGTISVAMTSPASSTLYAHHATGTLNLSGYKNVTFWIKNSTAINANQWQLALCSDTVCATPVNYIPIPAISTTGNWNVLNIAYGGNLGSSIQSIGLYSGSSPGTNANIFLNNITAATSSGLNLTSLISTNSAEQGGTEAWYGLQSIDKTGTILLLDSGGATTVNQGRGYYGTTQTATTYMRSAVQYIGGAKAQKTGSAGSTIQYQGGYNTATNAQTGETYFDGINGMAVNGFDFYGMSYIGITYLDFYRYYSGLNFNGSWNTANVTNLGCSGNGNGGAINFGGTYQTATITNINNNNTYNPLYLSSLYDSSITVTNIYSNLAASGAIGTLYALPGNNTITVTNVVNNSTAGVSPLNGFNNTFLVSNISYNGGWAIASISGSYGNTFINLTTSHNASGGINNGTNDILYFRNLTVGEATPFAGGQAGDNSRLYVDKYGGTANNFYVYTDGGTITSSTAQTHGTSSFSWLFKPNSATRTAAYPLDLQVAKIATTANQQVTVTAWFYISNANVTGALAVPANYLAGVSATNVTTSSGTVGSWQQVTLTFTPTETGVIPLYAWAYGGTTYSVYVTDMNISVAGGNPAILPMGVGFQGQPAIMNYPASGASYSGFFFQ